MRRFKIVTEKGVWMQSLPYSMERSYELQYADDGNTSDDSYFDFMTPFSKDTAAVIEEVIFPSYGEMGVGLMRVSGRCQIQ